MKNLKPKVIIICGPTASGKTDLSIKLAKRINGEIVSADSMLIYKRLNIGTAKPDKEEMQGIKHYMIDIIEPNERYSVADYKEAAKKAIDEIILKGKTPIIVGGTGLYIDALYYNIEYNEEKIDLEYRNKLEDIANKNGLEELYERALEIDKIAMEKISKNDKKRIIRVLEIYHNKGKTKTELEKESRQKEIPYNYSIFGLSQPRDELYEKINQRVDIMIEKGLVKEVEDILSYYNEFPTAMQAIGYKEVVSYLKGECTKEEMIEKIKMESRRYAKRQLTWFRKNKDIIWIENKNIEHIMEVLYSG